MAFHPARRQQVPCAPGAAACEAKRAEVYSEDGGYNKQIDWKLRECNDKGGIRSAFLSIIVAPVTGPFQVVVQAKARVRQGPQLRYLPWPSDHPVLFDGVTEKWIEAATRGSK